MPACVAALPIELPCRISRSRRWSWSCSIGINAPIHRCHILYAHPKTSSRLAQRLEHRFVCRPSCSKPLPQTLSPFSLRQFSMPQSAQMLAPALSAFRYRLAYTQGISANARVGVATSSEPTLSISRHESWDVNRSLPARGLRLPYTRYSLGTRHHVAGHVCGNGQSQRPDDIRILGNCMSVTGGDGASRLRPSTVDEDRFSLIAPYYFKVSFNPRLTCP